MGMCAVGMLETLSLLRLPFVGTTAESSAREDVLPANESSSLLHSGRNAGSNAEQQAKLVKAALYAVQVFYSFFIM